jgi:hypothetical protein
MLFFVLATWIVGIVVSLIYGNRAMPLVVLLLGCIVLAATVFGLGGWWVVASLAVLSAIIWIANKKDMT